MSAAKRMVRPVVVSCALVAMTMACGSGARRVTSDGTDEGGVPTTEAGSVTPGLGGFDDGSVDASSSNACRKMDIVFVIDNSFTMEEEQENLRKNFPRFAQVLDRFTTKSGEPLDYRVAVTSTDSDRDKGAFRTNGGSGRPWLDRSDGIIVDAFSRRATLGTGGSSYERPLESLRLALTERIADGANGSFRRDDALLAFVILTDEDEGGAIEDRPARPIPDYLTFLDGLTGNRARWATALIAGLGPGRCESSFGEAYEATRLLEFVAKTGKNATSSSICDADLSSGLDKALRTFELACGSFVPR